MRTPDLSANAITSVSNRLFPIPGGPSMTSTPPRPCDSAATNAPITFNSPARPRIGGVTSRWPPTSKWPVEGPTGCPVYRLLDCRCSARHCRHPPIYAEYTSTLLGVHAICSSTSARAHRPRITHERVAVEQLDLQLVGSRRCLRTKELRHRRRMLLAHTKSHVAHSQKLTQKPCRKS